LGKEVGFCGEEGGLPCECGKGEGGGGDWNLSQRAEEAKNQVCRKGEISSSTKICDFIGRKVVILAGDVSGRKGKESVRRISKGKNLSGWHRGKMGRPRGEGKVCPSVNPAKEKKKGKEKGLRFPKGERKKE